MTQHAPRSQQDSRATPSQEPLIGAMIDANGREIPITDSMIQHACQALEFNCVGAALNTDAYAVLKQAHITR